MGVNGNLWDLIYYSLLEIVKYNYLKSTCVHYDVINILTTVQSFFCEKTYFAYAHIYVNKTMWDSLHH